MAIRLSFNWLLGDGFSNLARWLCLGLDLSSETAATVFCELIVVAAITFFALAQG